MANYRNIGLVPAPFKAGVDLSNKLGYAVAPGSIAGEVIVAVGPSGNPWPWGIVAMPASSGTEVPVTMAGPAKACCEANACSLRWGAWLFVASDGQLEPLATEANGTVALPLSSSPVFARYMDSGTVSSGSVLAQVYIFPIPLSTCGILGAS